MMQRVCRLARRSSRMALTKTPARTLGGGCGGAESNATEDHIVRAAREWIEWDTNEETRSTINELLDIFIKDGDGELRPAMENKLVFGTAGLRGKMGAGYGCMNELTVMQATDGLCTHAINVFGDEEAKQRGLVIGYDHRQRGTLSSRRFAHLAAAIAVSRGFKVNLFSELVATPLVPFGVTSLNAAVGIMVTASHNPGADNGYKVYWENGAQIIPPHDSGIASLIDLSRSTWTEARSRSSVQLVEDSEGESLYALPLCVDPYEDIVEAYAAGQVRHFSCRERLPRDDDSASRIVYTPMHGVGHPYVERAFERFGLHPPIVVESQAQPDPTFPTVTFPNPEEGADALDLSFEAAQKSGSSVVLANDPDADRLAVAERQPDNTWRVFTGNEIGSLLGHWEWRKWRAANPDADPSSVCMLASAVSSTHLGMMAKHEGFAFEQTLTGFKWMGNRAEELQREGREVLFAFEEAIGFCVGPNAFVRDKDGVTAAAVFAEMYLQLRAEKRTISEHLEDLGERYGHCLNRSDYVVCEDPTIIASIFDRLRNGGDYWPSCRDLEITGVRDLTTGFDSSTPDNKTELPASSSSQMITYTFDGGRSHATLRTSGTEPKIKCYVEMRGTDANESLDALRTHCNHVFETVRDEMLQPELNGLRGSGENR